MEYPFYNDLLFVPQAHDINIPLFERYPIKIAGGLRYSKETARYPLFPRNHEVFLRITNDENENVEEYEENENLIEENCLEIFGEKLIEEGYDFYISQYEGLFIKSFRILVRRWILFLFICLLPFFLQLFISRSNPNSEIILDMDDWHHLEPQNVFIAISQTEYDQQLFNSIQNLTQKRSPLTNLQKLTNMTQIQQLDQFFWMRRKSDSSSYSNEYFGLLFENSETVSMLTSHLIIGYEPFSLASQYLCQGQCYISTRLKFVKNRQNELNEKNILSFLKTFSLFSCFYGVLPGEMSEIYLLTYNLIYLLISILIIGEGRQLIRLMQISGLHPIINWTSRYLFDLILSQFYSFILYFIYSINYQNNNNSTLDQIINKTNLKTKNKFFTFTFIIAANTLPFIYLLTKLLKSDLIGGLLILLILYLIELFDLIRIITIIMLKGQMRVVLSYWLMNLIFPSLNGKRIIALLLKTSSKCLCQLIENNLEIKNKIGFIKELNEDQFWFYFILSLIQIVIFFIILCLIDIGFFNDQINQFGINLINDQFDETELDDDVREERLDLLSKRDYSKDPLTVIDIVQQYSKKQSLALDHLTFHVQQGECFGLLGFNGAGKTSLFQIIVGEEKAKNGFIYLNGKLSKGIRFDIGYCPQYDCINDQLTLEDYFYLFGRLRGIVNHHLQQTIQSIAQLFLLESFLKQYLRQLSGGTIRRMHTALAFIGYTNIILLDEPTTGVDPYSRRQMRKVFEYALKNDLTIILTSHSMEECELLCHRVGIMSKGQIQCLGNIQHLKSKFGKGYSIDIKIASDEENKMILNYFENLIEIEMIHQTESTILFQVNHSSPAKLFDLIEQIKDKYQIETYSIQQTTLEQIFISFQHKNK